VVTQKFIQGSGQPLNEFPAALMNSGSSNCSRGDQDHPLHHPIHRDPAHHLRFRVVRPLPFQGNHRAHSGVGGGITASPQATTMSSSTFMQRRNRSPGQLFNRMTMISKQQDAVGGYQPELIRSNVELEQRRLNMEIVFANVAAGSSRPMQRQILTFNKSPKRCSPQG